MIKILANPNFFKTELRKLQFRESKTFSISTDTRNTSILSQSLIAIMPEVKLPLFTINQFLYKQFF